MTNVPRIAGPNAVLGGVGGLPGATFVLFTHTDVTTPIALWEPFLTNQFDLFGVFSYTNAFSPLEPKRFFLLYQQESSEN